MLTAMASTLENTFAPEVRVFDEDLEETEIIARDMIDAVNRGKPFFYTPACSLMEIFFIRARTHNLSYFSTGFVTAVGY